MPDPQTEFIPSDTLLVLDLLTGAWLGIWRSPDFRLRYFAPFYDGDDPRLAILGATGDCVALFPPGGALADAGAEIVSEARAAVRADLRQAPGAKLIAEVESIGARFLISYEADGVSEGSTVRDRQPDPELSRRFNAPPVDLTNADDTLQDPYRDDYSHIIPEEGTDMDEDTGWVLEARQRRHETVRLPRRGHSFTVGITGTHGRVAARALAVVTTPKPVGRTSPL